MNHTPQEEILVILAEIFSESERPDKISVKLDSVSKSMTVTYVGLDEDWFDELSEACGQLASTKEPTGWCECHERDSSSVCDFCYSRGFRGHMQKEDS